ncbi:class I SAM-dependent methyltransferase [Gluconacetobacter sacchari]|uniref:class I SAM-dependent methyltransferase n=1 Tax=Gluconacetobacter sacchari TaxID=92759 RepID=UPI0039B62A20
MANNKRDYFPDVYYRFPNRLKARSVLQTRYGRDDWYEWLAGNIPLPAGAVVADVGCGAGSLWTKIPQNVRSDLKLRLFDLSQTEVEVARTSISSLGRWADVEVSVANAEALPLPDAYVDTTIAISMLHQLRDPVAGIREMKRVTRDGGAVAIVLSPENSMAELSALVYASLGSRHQTQNKHLSSERGLALFRREFSCVEVVRYDDHLQVTDPIDLLGYLRSLPAADKRGAMDKFARMVEDAFTLNDVFKITKADDLIIGYK